MNKSGGFFIFIVMLIGLSTGLGATDVQCHADLEHSVIQVFAHSAEFDWITPYKTPKAKTAAGTGFFISDDGYLLTNFHVINAARSVRVVIPCLGCESFEATLIGVCPRADIALLRIQEKGIEAIKKQLGCIPYLHLGNSDEVTQRDSVFVVGYPLGFRYLKVTSGIIGGREYLGGMSYLHVTAALNQGNSGGPAINAVGEVIGVNAAGINQAQNMGYMIPINDIKILLADLHTTKLLRKPILGILSNSTTNEHARSLNNPIPAGCLINYVYPESLAEQAGFKIGDMIYEVNGHIVDRFGDIAVSHDSEKICLEEFLGHQPLHSTISFIVYRYGERLSFSVIWEGDKPLYSSRTIYPFFEDEFGLDYEVIGGMVVMQWRRNHRDYFMKTYGTHALEDAALQQIIFNPLYAMKKALVIVKKLDGSLVDRTNCFTDSFLLKTVNGKEVETLEDFRAALLLSSQTGTLAISMHSGASTVFSLKDIFDEEFRMRKDFMIPLSSTIQSLYDEYMKNKK